MTDELRKALARFLGEDAWSPSDRGAAAADALETRYGIRLPEDFKTYLVEACPAEESMYGNAFSLWSPDQIKSLRDECGSQTPPNQLNPEIELEADRYLVFADFLCWCYAYAICCSDSPNRGKVALIGAAPDHFVADSFCEFLQLAAQNSPRLHVGPDGTSSAP